MNLEKYLSITPEIRMALNEGMPVVALESTILSHGMPYPENVEFAYKVEEIVRNEGAVPATTAIIGGQLKIGLTEDELELMCRSDLSCNRHDRRNDGSLYHDDRGNGGNPYLCNGRHRRRASRRGDDYGYFRRSAGAGKNPCRRCLRGRKVHSGYWLDAGISGNDGRSRAGSEHG